MAVWYAFGVAIFAAIGTFLFVSQARVASEGYFVANISHL